MKIKLDLVDFDSELDRSAIFDPLVEYNIAKAGEPSFLPLNVVIRDAADKAVGGLWGHTVFGWLTIELLYVPENLRKQSIGSKILVDAEAEASSRDCHSARLDTFEFQSAKTFYEKCGYEQFGEIANCPIGFTRYFMKKSLSTKADIF